jgi:hypothetical protein
MSNMTFNGPGKGLSYRADHLWPDAVTRLMTTVVVPTATGDQDYTLDTIERVCTWLDRFYDAATQSRINFTTIGLDKELRYLAVAWHGDCRDVLVTPVGSFGFGRRECSVQHYNQYRELYEQRFPVVTLDLYNAQVEARKILDGAA